MVITYKILWENTTITYSNGARNTGNGVGIQKVTPFFSSWLQTDAPPNGFGREGTAGPGCFVHDDYLYSFVSTSEGTGPGVYRYELDITADPITMSYDSYVALGDLGFHASIDMFGSYGAFVYDSSEESVAVFAYCSSNGTYTPCLKKWSLSSWPFTDSNHEWASGLIQRWGSYDANDVVNYPIDMMLDSPNNRLFISSLYTGNVHTINYSTGAVLGVWNTYTAYAYTYPVWFCGIDPSDSKPIVGGYRSDQGNNTLRKWDISDLDNWSADTVIFEYSAGTSTVAAGWKFAPGWLTYTYSAVNNLNHINLDDIFGDDCGLVACIVTQKGRVYDSTMQMRVFSPDLSTYYEIPLSAQGAVRGVPNAIRSAAGQSLSYLSLSNGSRLISSNRTATLEKHEEAPSEAPVVLIGYEGIQVNDAVVKYTFTADTGGTPGSLYLVVAGPGDDRRDVTTSTHPGKHAFRMRKNGGVWTDWRAGTRQLTFLNYEIDSTAAWDNWSSGDLIEIEHKMNTGFMKTLYNNYSHDGTEAAGFSDVVLVPEDKGPPRDVVPILYYDDLTSAGGSANVNLSNRLSV